MTHGTTSSSAPRHTVGLVGAGRIVAGFDTPGDAMILTHAHALHGHPRFTVAGILDADPAAAARAAATWGLPVAESFAALRAQAPEVLLIGVPDAHHVGYLEAALDPTLGALPKLVLCEKPLTPSLATSTRLVDAYANAGVGLAVVYQRRYDDDVRAMRDAYRAGTLGALLTGTVYYSKGVLHNGSHAIDLLRFVFGEFTTATALSQRDDFTASDPSVSAHLRIADADVMLAIADERCYSLFEIDLVFERARYRFADGGLQFERSRAVPDPVWDGYTILAPQEQRPSTLPQAMRRLWDAVADSLDGGAPLASDARGALATQATCEDLLHQVRQ